MPQYRFTNKNTKKTKESNVEWDDFRGGLNKFLTDNELNKNEYTDGENLIMVGKGTLKVRPGISNYFTAGATGFCRTLKSVKFNATDNHYVLAMTDWGLLTKKSGASYTVITGASWSSGYPLEMEMIDDKVWFINEVDNMKYWDESSIHNYGLIAAPTIIGVSHLSANATGTYLQYYRVSAITDNGETLGSLEAYATGCPLYPSDNSIRLSWLAPSAASGYITGYNIYGRESGDRMFYINRVNAYSNYYEDNGENAPNYFQSPPVANSTAGRKAKYIINHKGRLVIANTENGKCTIEWSGTGANIGKFDWSVGGGYLTLNKNAGDEITGVYDAFDKIIVFFNRSLYTVDISQSLEYLGGSIIIPSYKKVSDSIGCVNQRTIRQVENDVFFVSRRQGGGVALMVLGYEPNIMADVLRTNEISIKVKPYLTAIADNQIDKIHGFYKDNKYYLAYPTSGEGQPNKVIIYDRERGSWTPPQSYGANTFEIEYDDNNIEHFLIASHQGPTVYEQKDTNITDCGTAIRGYFKSRKESFDDYRKFKELKEFFINLTGILGTVYIRILVSDRDDNVYTARSATITKLTQTGSLGYGFDPYGTVQYGDTAGSGTQQQITDIIRWMQVNAIGRYFQVEVESTAVSSTWELSGISMRARELSMSFLPGASII